MERVLSRKKKSILGTDDHGNLKWEQGKPGLPGVVGPQTRTKRGRERKPSQDQLLPMWYPEYIFPKRRVEATGSIAELSWIQTLSCIAKDDTPIRHLLEM